MDSVIGVNRLGYAFMWLKSFIRNMKAKIKSLKTALPYRSVLFRVVVMVVNKRIRPEKHIA